MGVWVSGVEGGVVGVAEEGGGEFVIVMGGEGCEVIVDGGVIGGLDVNCNGEL